MGDYNRLCSKPLDKFVGIIRGEEREDKKRSGVRCVNVTESKTNN